MKRIHSVSIYTSVCFVALFVTWTWSFALEPKKVPTQVRSSKKVLKPKASKRAASKWQLLLQDKDVQKRKKAIRTLRHMGARAASAVHSLHRALNDAHWSVREGAIRWFGENGLSWSQVNVPQAILRLTADPNAHVRVAALWALGFVAPTGYAQATKAAIRAVTDKRARVREEGVALLGRLGHLSKEIREVLFRSCEDPSWYVQAAAIRALDRLKMRDKESVRLFARAVQSPEPSVRLVGVHALIRLQDLSVPYALSFLRSKRSDIQLHGLDILASIPRRPDTALQAIVQMLSLPSNATRESAALALGRMGRSAQMAIPALGRCLRDAHAPVRAAAIWALAQMGETSIPMLSQALRSKQLKMKMGAARVLSALGPKAVSATLFLVDAMLDRNWLVRREVAWALYRIGSAIRGKLPQSMLPILINGLQDRSWKVRFCLLHILGHIGPKANIVIGWFGPKAVSTLGAVYKLQSDKDVRVQRAARVVYKKLQTP